MATWSKIMGGGDWPVYTDKAALTQRFGRYCIQPLERGTGPSLAEAFRKALLESLPGAAVTAARVRLRVLSTLTAGRAEEVAAQVRRALRLLRLSSAARFPIHGSLRASGPGAPGACDLSFNARVHVLVDPGEVAVLLPGESLEVDFVVHWNRGSFSSSEAARRDVLDVPNGWTRLDGCHSPVLDARLYPCASGGAVAAEQLVIEVTTDGSLGPEDALRRAGQLISGPSPRRVAG